MIKRILQGILPSGMVNLLKACHYRSWIGHAAYLYKKWSYQRYFESLNKGLPPNQITILPDITLTPANEDVRHAFNHFTYIEPEMVEEMKAFVRVMKGKKTLLDVGALYGVFSLVFTVRPDATSYALEPNPTSMNVLKQNMALNSSHRIIPFQVAAGNRQGQVTFVDDGMHWIAKPVNGGCDSNGSKTVSINATTLDTVCSSNGIVPDIIKIDVEGYEFQVLQGGVQTLIESKPMLFIEIHPDLLAQHGISSVGIMEFLASKGYRFYDNSLAEVGIKHFSIDRVFRVICAHHVLS